MSALEINKAIETIEKKIFFLSMKDRWTSADYLADSSMRNELRTYKTMLEG